MLINPFNPVECIEITVSEKKVKKIAKWASKKKNLAGNFFISFYDDANFIDISKQIPKYFKMYQKNSIKLRVKYCFENSKDAIAFKMEWL